MKPNPSGIILKERPPKMARPSVDGRGTIVGVGATAAHSTSTNAGAKTAHQSH